MKKILVLNGNSYFNAIRNLGVPSFDFIDFVENPHEYGLVLFTGGEDVDPSMYGETSPKRLCGSNLHRDLHEKEIYEIALNNGIKMTGICRGSQFINVMNGGRMIHHLNGHAGADHLMETLKDDELIPVNSAHHQMSIPSKDGIVVGWASEKRSNIYYGDKDLPVEWSGPETEALLYPKTQCFAVQYHPEWLSDDHPGYRWYWEAVRDFLNMPIEYFTILYKGEKVQKHMTFS